MGKINKEWHLANKMPKNPTTKERINWHIEHAKHCQCRQMPESIKQMIFDVAADICQNKRFNKK